ncbi:hypothetical protein [Actinokineospora enzanensis]|uniref:hypothetical protein n=1 Tax=Actinokineospora enzanensis TaxID=155975 RepID=UPI00146EECA3|nr:hypothetical protein [Actinokineospora enzanensis]
MSDAARPCRRIVWTTVVAVVILAIAVALSYRPWLSPWWPTRHEAADLPTSCPTLPALPTPGLPTRLTASDGTEGANCAWGTTDGLPLLDAQYSLCRRVGNHSATERAKHETASRVTRPAAPNTSLTLGADTPVRDLGDEARISAHGSLVILVARKSNVVLTVHYYSPAQATDDQARTIAINTARALLDIVHID